MRHRLDWRGGKRRGGKLFFGAEPLGVADELEAARVMLKRNLAARGDSFTTYRGDMACLTTGVGWAADRRVTVDNGGTPVFKRITKGSRPPGGLEEGSGGSVA